MSKEPVTYFSAGGIVLHIEPRPFFAQYDAIETMKAYGCVSQAWEPLAEGRHGVLIHPVLSGIIEHCDPNIVKYILRAEA